MSPVSSLMKFLRIRSHIHVSGQRHTAWRTRAFPFGLPQPPPVRLSRIPGNPHFVHHALSAVLDLFEQLVVKFSIGKQNSVEVVATYKNARHNAQNEKAILCGQDAQERNAQNLRVLYMLK